MLEALEALEALKGLEALERRALHAALVRSTSALALLEPADAELMVAAWAHVQPQARLEPTDVAQVPVQQAPTAVRRLV